MSSDISVEVKELIMPLFVVEGERQRIPVASMPGIDRLSIDELVKEVGELKELGITSVALFPNIADELKDSVASESKNSNGLFQRAIAAVKKEYPDVQVVVDVAMDPYSSDGHDGLVRNGEIVNDDTLPILADMAVSQAQAGADVIAPSDMMDGRIGFIRQRLNEEGFKDVKILAYSAKYASAFYGPFRDALESQPRSGDKKTYQMNPANVNEAIREVQEDIKEGADMVMVKPGLPYLDVIQAVKRNVNVPVAAYNVSGEYAMVKAAGLNQSINEQEVVNKMLASIKRAGADIILTYFAKQYAQNKCTILS